MQKYVCSSAVIPKIENQEGGWTDIDRLVE